MQSNNLLDLVICYGDLELVPMWGPEILEKYNDRNVVIKNYRGGFPLVGECVFFMQNNDDCWGTNAQWTLWDATILEVNPSHHRQVLVELRK